MERVRVRVCLAFPEIELAPDERRRIAGIVQHAASFQVHHAAKLRQEFGAAFPDRGRQLRVEVGGAP